MFNTGIQIFLIFTNNYHIHNGVLGGNKGVVRLAGTDIGVQAQYFPHGYI